MNKRHISIGIITPPIGGAGVVPLSNLIDITSYISDSVFVITGDVDIFSQKKNNSNISIKKITYRTKSCAILKIVKHFLLQVKISYNLFIWRNNVDILIFFLDSHIYILPTLIGKLLKKQVLFLLAASISNSGYVNNNFFSSLMKLFEIVTFKIANRIVVYSPCLINKWKIQKYAETILIAHEHFLDFNAFTQTISYNNRPHLIGYIGRLSGEKGVQYFVEALPSLLNKYQDLHAFIGGDGQLKESIESSIHENCLSTRVHLAGWISHDELPKYLNQLRLLVLPSYTEGLPNIMLEAMACGTPVVATPVGAIPDVIFDEKTGFIMEDNSPESIVENVVRALTCSKLEEIAEAGRRHVEEEYQFMKGVDRWKELLNRL